MKINFKEGTEDIKPTQQVVIDGEEYRITGISYGYPRVTLEFELQESLVQRFMVGGIIPTDLGL